MVPVVGNEMDLALAKFNLPPLSLNDMIYFFTVSLFIGMMLMWLYATLFPIYNKRCKALMASVLIIWLPGYLLANIANVVYGFMPVKLTVIGIIWGFGELLISGMIASRLFPENTIK